MSLLPGGTATVTGTFAGGAPTGLSEAVDGVSVATFNPVITTTSGSGATAAGTFSFQFIVPQAGMHSIHVAGAGVYQAAVDFVLPASPAAPAGDPTLTLTASSNVQVGAAFTVSGTYAGYSTSPTLSLIADGITGNPLPLPSGSTVTGGVITIRAHAFSQARTHSFQVQDSNGVMSNVVSFPVT